MRVSKEFQRVSESFREFQMSYCEDCNKLNLSWLREMNEYIRLLDELGVEYSFSLESFCLQIYHNEFKIYTYYNKDNNFKFISLIKNIINGNIIYEHFPSYFLYSINPYYPSQPQNNDKIGLIVQLKSYRSLQPISLMFDIKDKIYIYIEHCDLNFDVTNTPNVTDKHIEISSETDLLNYKTNLLNVVNT